MNTYSRLKVWGTATLLLLLIVAAASRILTATDTRDRPLAGSLVTGGANALGKLYNGVFGY